MSELIQRSEFDKAYAEIVAFVSSPEYRTVMAPVFAYDGLKNQLPKNIAAARRIVALCVGRSDPFDTATARP